jgi:hypothetical protein
MKTEKTQHKTKKKTKPEIISLSEDYIIRNRYTRFLFDEGKRHEGNRMLICWYIGNETGRLVGAYWKEGEQVPRALAYNIAENGLSFFRESAFNTWDELFYRLRLSPKAYRTPSMAHVFSDCVNSVPRDNGKIIQFPARKPVRTTGRERIAEAAHV